MAPTEKISLKNAIFININIILGAGIFINTVELAKKTGAIGGLLYLGVGALMLPLVLSLTTLIQRHPHGSFYTFGAQEIHPFAGFLSAWAYFVGKLASCAIMIHASILLLQQLFPLIAPFNPLILDSIVLALFVGGNMLNMQTSCAIQTSFLFLKLIPILFAIIAGLFIFHGSYIIPSHTIWSGIPTSIPLLIYGTIGFEASIALSQKIENAPKNAAKAVLYSYVIVIVLAALYQTIFYGALGQALRTAHDYRNAFPALLNSLFSCHPLLAKKMYSILHLAIASSALGGSYGILFSNAWNLHTLATHNHIAFSHILSRFNRYAIPYLCIITEGCIVALYLYISRGKQLPLQQLGALGVTLSYGMSVLALLYAQRKNPQYRALFVPLLGLVSCSLLLSTCIYSFFFTGIAILFAFIILLLLGSCMFAKKHLF